MRIQDPPMLVVVLVMPKIDDIELYVNAKTPDSVNRLNTGLALDIL